MTIQVSSHPLDRLSRADRRRWRRLDREAQGVLDAQQLRRLRALAGSGFEVEFVSLVDGGSPLVSVVELRIDQWRLVGRAPAQAGTAIRAALAAGPVRLAAAGRYGPYWTLTFAGRGAPLAVLVNGLVLSRRDGGLSDELRQPRLELVE
jgi:hypothetical protein